MGILTLLALAALLFGYVKLAIPAVRFALARPERFPAAVWSWPEAAFTVSVVMFFLIGAAGSIGKPPGQIDLKTIQSSIALYGAVVLLVTGFLVYRKFNLVAAFGLHWPGWMGGLLMTAAALGLVLPPIYAAQWLGYTFISPETAPQPIVTFLLDHSGWRDRLAVGVIAVVAAPVTEELVFRGCLYGLVRQIGGRWAAVAVSSLLFALIHGHVPSLPGLVILAVGLAWLYEATGSLWAPIALHAGFNALSIFATLQWPELLQ
jgi:membrane protease YdiL (CAAX protease family)